MDKNKILDLYRHEKDERQVQCQRKALLKGMSFLVTVALTLMFFSFEFQEVPTVFYTIYINYAYSWIVIEYAWLV